MAVSARLVAVLGLVGALVAVQVVSLARASGQRALRQHDPERVQVRLDPPDPVEVQLDELAGRHLPRADQLRLAKRTRVCKLGRVQDAATLDR